jgi:lipopolysaccharide/colanic/teichoic acid biosynthesis glycosyltransferase
MYLAKEVSSPSPLEIISETEVVNDAKQRLQRFVHRHLSEDELTSYLVSKRVFDLFIAFSLLVLLAPVMVLVGALVKFTSPGGMIYRQRRLTAGGKRFWLYKFRTMRRDAEAKTGPVWAQQDDPRVTTLGRFLRKTRLDELPQLFNVLRGDMSLIGPRPERPELAVELEKKLRRFHERLHVKAGITGLAQVEADYAANIESYRRKLALDIVYVRNCSLRLDFLIAVRTLFVVLTGKGAR